MKESEEKLLEIFKYIFNLSVVKDAYYKVIIDMSIPIILKKIRDRNGITADDLLEGIYSMNEDEFRDTINDFISISANVDIRDSLKDVNLNDVLRYLEEGDEES